MYVPSSTVGDYSVHFSFVVICPSSPSSAPSPSSLSSSSVFSVRLVVRPPVSVLPSRRPFRCRRRSSFVKPSRQIVCLCSAVVNIHHRFGALRAPNITYSGAVPPRPRRMCPNRDLYGTNFGPLDKSRGTYSRDGFLLY